MALLGTMLTALMALRWGSIEKGCESLISLNMDMKYQRFEISEKVRLKKILK